MLIRFSKGTARKFLGRGSALIMVYALCGARILADPLLEHPDPNDGILIISKSCAAVAGGAKATLIVGPFQPRGDIYLADYQVKVSPYFFKNEKGKLAVVISSEAFKKARQGMAVELTGTATTDGESRARLINVVVNPRTEDEGGLKVWFIAGGKKTVFDTSYRLVRADSLHASKN